MWNYRTIVYIIFLCLGTELTLHAQQDEILVDTVEGELYLSEKNNVPESFGTLSKSSWW
jgi:hypothetical protein